eukprot:jgi/Mesen1/5040/ME000025S04439
MPGARPSFARVGLSWHNDRWKRKVFGACCSAVPGFRSSAVSSSLVAAFLLLSCLLTLVHSADSSPFLSNSERASRRRLHQVADGALESDAQQDAPSLSNPPKKFVLYRLVGNDMPPLQSPGQLYWNLKYTLENEPNLENCQKRWIVNNIVNMTARGLIVDLILKHGYKLDDILIRRLDYDRLQSKSYPEGWETLLTEQNEGRNAAIEDGIMYGARWILAFDGNQFITKSAWQGINNVASWSEKQGFKYFKVPMYRLHYLQNASWLTGDATHETCLQYAPLLGESQLAFRNDAPNRYQQGVQYGNANKWQFLEDVCGPKGAKKVCGCGNVLPETTEALGKHSKKFSLIVGQKCGYSLRLWFYPPSDTDQHKALKDFLYRGSLRTQALSNLVHLARTTIEEGGYG